MSLALLALAGASATAGTSPSADEAALLSAAVVSAGSPPCHPAAPAKAGDKPAAGTVTLALLVNPNGRVTEAKITKSSGLRELDKAAIVGVAHCRFEPALIDGAPAPSWFSFVQTWPATRAEGAFSAP